MHIFAQDIYEFYFDNIDNNSYSNWYIFFVLIDFCHERFGNTRRNYDGSKICDCSGYECTACWEYTYNVPIPYR